MITGVKHKTFAEKVAEVVSEIIIPLIEPVVIDYLEENPSEGGSGNSYFPGGW
jgi:hypothetical protein